jgi:hypothetical protein
VKGNAQAYRSGMVLGLTLAEIMVLLVFMMLLAAAALLLRRDSAAASLDDQVRGMQAARAAAATIAARVADLEAALIQSRQIAAEADQARGRTEANARIEIAQARATIAGLTRELAAARTEAQGLLGQNAQMRGEIQRINGNAGSGLPYCWTTPDGKPVTLLRVTLRDTGVIAQDPAPRPRPDDPLWARIAAMPRGAIVPMEEFLALAGGVIAQSNTDRCRHAVEVIDGTGPTNKRGYKGLMNQLWGSFLLREVGG